MLNIIRNITLITGLAVTGIGFSSMAFADSPETLKHPDSHSVEVTGKVDLYRVQVQGMHLGKGKNNAEAEVFVTLDTNPGMVYALQIHGDSPPANTIIANTLRDAYVNKVPVTLYHQIALKKDNNFKILMVQLN